MESHVMIGAALVMVGLSDAAVGLLLIGPKVKDPNKKVIVLGAMMSSALTFAALGICVLTGVVSLPGT